MICNGQSTIGYPSLAAIVGANVPDLRGEFIRGWDGSRGVDIGRLFGSIQGDAIRNIIGTFDGEELTMGDGVSATVSSGALYALNSKLHYSSTGVPGLSAAIGFDASRVVPTAEENRPRNVALLPCIKY